MTFLSSSSSEFFFVPTNCKCIQMRVIDEWIIYQSFDRSIDWISFEQLADLLDAYFLFFVENNRLFASQCAKCRELFSENEFFIRTTSHRRFHPDCFRCDHCDRMLTSGDEYYLHGQNEIFCREDYQQLKLADQSNGTSTAGMVKNEEEKKERNASSVHIYLYPKRM